MTIPIPSMPYSCGIRYNCVSSLRSEMKLVLSSSCFLATILKPFLLSPSRNYLFQIYLVSVFCEDTESRFFLLCTSSISFFFFSVPSTIFILATPHPSIWCELSSQSIINSLSVLKYISLNHSRLQVDGSSRVCNQPCFFSPVFHFCLESEKKKAKFFLCCFA